MSSTHVLKIFSIIEYFDDDKRMIKKGENAVESNHVKSMQFDADLMMIRGEIHASMREKFYHVEIILNQSGEIVHASCACPKGIKCHHIAALAIFGHRNISVTDKECSWNAPKMKDLPVQTAEELYPHKPYSAISQDITEDHLNELRTKLNSLGNTVGFTWLLQKRREEESVTLQCPIIEDILSSIEFVQSIDPLEFFKQKCAVDNETIVKMAEFTKMQSNNEYWYIIRKFRLTASNFGTILSACMRNKFPESLFKTLVGAYNLEGIKAIQWGRCHEKHGLEYLQNSCGLHIEQTGIWLSNSGLLGASPDGLVGDDAIIEVKCPYSYRNDILSQKLINNEKYIIYYDNGNLVINKNHNYYHQIQGNLHILKRLKCYLCIWTLKYVVVVLVEHDNSWSNNISILEDFYFNQYLPKITSVIVRNNVR